MLVHGAAGGVGTATLQVAKGYGARTIAVVSTEEKAELRPRGRRRRGRARSTASRTRRWSSPTARASTSSRRRRRRRLHRLPALRSRRRAGCSWSASHPATGIPEVKVNRLLLNNVDVRGVGWGAYAMVRPGYMHEQWDALLPLMESGVIKPADRRDVRARGLRPGADRHGRAQDPGQVGREGPRLTPPGIPSAGASLGGLGVCPAVRTPGADWRGTAPPATAATSDQLGAGRPRHRWPPGARRVRRRRLPAAHRLR